MKLILLLLAIAVTLNIGFVVLLLDTVHGLEQAESYYLLESEKAKRIRIELEYEAGIDLLGSLGYQPAFCFDNKICFVKE